MTDPSIVAIQAFAVPWLRDTESAYGHYLWLDYSPHIAEQTCHLRFRGRGGDEMKRKPDYGYIEGMMTLRYTEDLVFPPFMVENGLAPRQLFLCHFEWDGAHNPIEGTWDGDLVPQFIFKERLHPLTEQIRWEHCLRCLWFVNR